jgi:hypothetical protein
MLASLRALFACPASPITHQLARGPIRDRRIKEREEERTRAGKGLGLGFRVKGLGA